MSLVTLKHNNKISQKRIKLGFLWFKIGFHSMKMKFYLDILLADRYARLQNDLTKYLTA